MKTTTKVQCTSCATTGAQLTDALTREGALRHEVDAYRALLEKARAVLTSGKDAAKLRDAVVELLDKPRCSRCNTWVDSSSISVTLSDGIKIHFTCATPQELGRR